MLTVRLEGGEHRPTTASHCAQSFCRHFYQWKSFFLKWRHLWVLCHVSHQQNIAQTKTMAQDWKCCLFLLTFFVGLTLSLPQTEKGRLLCFTSNRKIIDINVKMMRGKIWTVNWFDLPISFMINCVAIDIFFDLFHEDSLIGEMHLFF